MSYKFFENTDCDFYPCHENMDEINCLFCFCPLFHLDCGNDNKIDGKKDCQRCTFPHHKENYDEIIRILKSASSSIG